MQNSPNVLNTIATQTGYTQARILDLVGNSNTEIHILITDRDRTNPPISVIPGNLVISDRLIQELADINEDIKTDPSATRATLAILAATQVLSTFTEFGDRQNNNGNATAVGAGVTAPNTNNTNGRQNSRPRPGQTRSQTVESTILGGNTTLDLYMPSTSRYSAGKPSNYKGVADPVVIITTKEALTN